MAANIILLGQMIESMSEAIDRLERAANENKLNEFNTLKKYILDLHEKIKKELEK